MPVLWQPTEEEAYLLTMPWLTWALPGQTLFPSSFRLDPKDGKDSRRFINLSLRGHVGEPPQEKQGSWNWNILSFVSTYVDWTESEEEKWEET